MSVELSFEFDKASMALIQKHLAKLATGGLRAAAVEALKDTGHQTRRAMAKHLAANFDRPTPYITRSPKFVLDEKKLALSILPTQDTRRFAFTGGQGRGLDAQHVLQAQEWGGQRNLKRFEIALSAMGVLPAGMQTAIPALPFAGSDDGRGNFRGPFIRRLLAVLGKQQAAQSSQAKAQAKAAKRRGHKTGRARQGMVLNGWSLFLVKQETTAKAVLAAGIWARQNKQLRPVVIFTRAGHYRKKNAMLQVMQKSDLQTYLQRRMRYRIRHAVGI